MLYVRKFIHFGDFFSVSPPCTHVPEPRPNIREMLLPQHATILTDLHRTQSGRRGMDDYNFAARC